MLVTIRGEVRRIAPSRRNDKYVDLAVLQENAINGVRLWAYADAPGLDGAHEGSTVEVVAYVQAKNSQGGSAYLNCQAREITVLDAGKLSAVS